MTRLAFGLRLLGTVAVLLGAGTIACADVVYQNDQWPPASGGYEIFNCSETTETEDNWVANSFQVVEGGTRLLSISFGLSQPLTSQDAFAVIYMGADLLDPSAGGGLVRLATTHVRITHGPEIGMVTIRLDDPVDLQVDDIFYAALMLPGIPGNVFPFTLDRFTDLPPPPPLSQSFFDVGPEQSAPYDLDMTQNATVVGGTHPVVGAAVPHPANLVLRVNATATP
jgi:hypothetical protein